MHLISKPVAWLDILPLSHHSESFVLLEVLQLEIHNRQSKAMTDRQSIHMNSNLLFPGLNCPNHKPAVQNQRHASYPTPVPVLTGFPPSPAFPVNYNTTARRKTAHLSSSSATASRAFPKVLIAKSYKKLEVVAFEEGSLWDVRAYKWLPLSPNRT